MSNLSASVEYGIYNTYMVDLCKSWVSANYSDYCIYQTGHDNLVYIFGDSVEKVGNGFHVENATVRTLTYNGYGSNNYGYRFYDTHYDTCDITNPQSIALYNSVDMPVLERGSYYEEACCIAVCVLFLFLLCREFFRSVS